MGSGVFPVVWPNALDMRGRPVCGQGEGGGWTESERASNEQIRPLRAEHGAQSDKNTLQAGNQGPSNEEALTNGPRKCDRGLNCAHAPPPPHPTPLSPVFVGHLFNLRFMNL